MIFLFNLTWLSLFSILTRLGLVLFGKHLRNEVKTLARMNFICQCDYKFGSDRAWLVNTADVLWKNQF